MNYIDAPACFLLDTCVICGELKAQSQCICEDCNDDGMIFIGLSIRSWLK